MAKYEYKQVGGLTLPEFEANCNAYGKEGWQMVSYDPQFRGHFFCMMQRELVETSDGGGI